MFSFRRSLRFFLVDISEILPSFHGRNNRQFSVHQHPKIHTKPLHHTSTLSNKGEYLDGQDTLIRIGYYPSEAYFAVFGGGDSEEDNWWRSGEFLINKNDLAIIRHTTGDAKRGHFDDVIYQKVDGKYYLKQLTWYLEIEYDSKTRQFIDHQMLYVTKVTTGKKAARKALAGKFIDKAEDLADLNVKYNPDFWQDYQMLRTLGAPEEMQLTMDRIQRNMEARKGKRTRVNRDSL